MEIKKHAHTSFLVQSHVLVTNTIMAPKVALLGNVLANVMGTINLALIIYMKIVVLLEIPL